MRQVVAFAGNGHVLFLHGLQERRLRARTCTVDLVGHEQLRKHGSAEKSKKAAAGVALFENFRSDDVGRHQVGSELDSLPVKSENDAERFDESRLGKTGHTDKKAMTAREQRHQHLIDHVASARRSRGTWTAALCRKHRHTFRPAPPANRTLLLQ